MAKYSAFKYGAGVVYGNLQSSADFSKVVATALDYDKVELKIYPNANIDQEYLLVRSKIGYPEDPTGGVVIYQGTLDDIEITLTDDEANTGSPLPAGDLYYSLFILDAQGIWYVVAATSVLVPMDFGGYQKFMQSLPRMYTSRDQNPLSPIDWDGDLAAFMYGMALSMDEWNTRGLGTSPSENDLLINENLVYAQALGHGIIDGTLTTTTSANYRTNRESSYIFQYKGTPKSIAAFVESMTGWDVDIDPSPNLMLNLNDSSFEDGVGNWVASGGTLTTTAVNGTTVTAPTMSNDDVTYPFKSKSVGVATMSTTTTTLKLGGTTGVTDTIPVTAGNHYVAWVPVRNVSGTPSAKVRIDWYDKDGTLLSSSSYGSTVFPSGWGQVRTSVETAPAGALYAGLTVTLTGANTNVVHIDRVMFSEWRPDLQYRDARGVDILPHPNRVNQLVNPSFDAGVLPWVSTGSSISRDTSEKKYGLASCKVTCTGASSLKVDDSIPNRLDTYTFSIYVKASTGTITFTPFITYGSTTTTGTATSVGTTWTRVSLTVQIPAGYTTVTVGVNAASSNGNVWYADNALFENAYGVQPYFDGSMSSSNFSDAAWVGDAYNSRSMLYTGRNLKAVNLQKTLANIVTLGTPWRLKFNEGREDYSTALDILSEAVWWIDAKYSDGGLQKVKNLGYGGSALDASVGATTGGLRIEKNYGSGYVYVPGTAGYGLSVPDENALDITGDLDIRVKIALDDWTPNTANNWALLGKWQTTSTKSFGIFVEITTGYVGMYYSLDGTNTLTHVVNVATGLTDGSAWWIRVTRASATGVITAYKSQDGTSWTLIGSVTGTSGALYSSTSEISIGALYAHASFNMAGKVYRAQVYSGINGTKVLDIDCSTAALPNFTAVTGQTVSVVQSTEATDPKFLDHAGTNYIYCPNVSGNTISVSPIDPACAINGDLDLRGYLAADSWTAPTANIPVVGRWGSSAGSYSYALSVNGTGNPILQYSTDGTVINTRTATAVVPFSPGQAGWVRATFDVDNGAAGHTVTFYTSTDGSVWTQLGTPVVTAGVATIFTGGSPTLGIYNGGARGPAKFYRAQILNGINGTTVLDIDTSLATSGSAMTFTTTTGQTVSIGRATAGLKSTVVTSPVWLFGTDDYMLVTDNDLLDFGATDSMTMVAVVRKWATNPTHGTVLAKGGSSTGGYTLRHQSTTLQTTFIAQDGTNAPADFGPTATAGALEVMAGRLDRSSATVETLLDGVSNGTASASTLGSMATTGDVYVGRRSDGYYSDMELVSAAIFRRVLTDTEIAFITNYYKTRTP